MGAKRWNIAGVEKKKDGVVAMEAKQEKMG